MTHSLELFLLASLSFFPLLAYKNYVSKLQVFMGLVIAIIAVIGQRPGIPRDNRGIRVRLALVDPVSRAYQHGAFNWTS